ncbi:hypothetical protein GLYMA_16G047251v4 [Glycine max]|nr:hypothetical protein GLYMA_16G047251v4 [Glycine max]KAG4938272.1 hypothetical protein JHK86_044413 [Glycine max]KAG5107616.1 hypothetical protein JHK84_044523 [Glycine max]KAH1149997.1 hypothetical protein GYH30_044158 [Glycine max]
MVQRLFSMVLHFCFLIARPSSSPLFSCTQEQEPSSSPVFSCTQFSCFSS